MPCYLRDNVERQRGKGVFDGSIRGLRRLNAVGYGRDPTLALNLVYNPQGPSLPPPQAELQTDYKRVLGEQYGIVFNKLYVLANMPIHRFGSTLMGGDIPLMTRRSRAVAQLLSAAGQAPADLSSRHRPGAGSVRSRRDLRR